MFDRAGQVPKRTVVPMRFGGDHHRGLRPGDVFGECGQIGGGQQVCVIDNDCVGDGFAVARDAGQYPHGRRRASATRITPSITDLPVPTPPMTAILVGGVGSDARPSTTSLAAGCISVGGPAMARALSPEIRVAEPAGSVRLGGVGLDWGAAPASTGSRRRRDRRVVRAAVASWSRRWCRRRRRGGRTRGGGRRVGGRRRGGGGRRGGRRRRGRRGGASSGSWSTSALAVVEPASGVCVTTVSWPSPGDGDRFGGERAPRRVPLRAPRPGRRDPGERCPTGQRDRQTADREQQRGGCGTEEHRRAPVPGQRAASTSSVSASSRAKSSCGRGSATPGLVVGTRRRAADLRPWSSCDHASARNVA